MGGVNLKAKEIVGHRHILTFSDGPRTCLGKGFALVNFKVCSLFFFASSFWR
jgi:cytochrome P450